MFDPLMEIKQMVKSSDKRAQTVSGCFVLSRLFLFTARNVDEYFKNLENHVSKAFPDK